MARDDQSERVRVAAVLYATSDATRMAFRHDRSEAVLAAAALYAKSDPVWLDFFHHPAPRVRAAAIGGVRSIILLRGALRGESDASTRSMLEKRIMTLGSRQALTPGLG